jgi:hypothetical protein
MKEAANWGGLYSAAFTGVLVSPMLWHLGHMNICEIACSAATRVDLDQAISTLQVPHIGTACRSIGLLSTSI